MIFFFKVLVNDDIYDGLFLLFFLVIFLIFLYSLYKLSFSYLSKIRTVALATN